MNNESNQAISFCQAVMQNPSLFAEFEATRDENRFLARGVEIGEDNGYDFSAEDLKKAISHLRNAEDVEPNDKMLSAVAGGGKRDDTVCRPKGKIYCL